MNKQYAINRGHSGMLLYYMWTEAGLPPAMLSTMPRGKHTELVLLLDLGKTTEVEKVLATYLTEGMHG